MQSDLSLWTEDQLWGYRAGKSGINNSDPLYHAVGKEIDRRAEEKRKADRALAEAAEERAIFHATGDHEIGDVIRFVRHGLPPASGRSWNHRDNFSEDGVSVYLLAEDGVRYCGWHFGISAKPAYVGTGRIVGWGSDGEPLVEVLKIRRSKKYDRNAI